MKFSKKIFVVIVIIVAILITAIYFIFINPQYTVYTNNIKLKFESEIEDYTGNENLGYKYEEDGEFLLHIEYDALIGDRKILLTEEQYNELKEGENYFFIVKFWRYSDRAKVYDVSKRNMAR